MSCRQPLNRSRRLTLRFGSLEPIVLVDGHPRHAAPLGGERVARACELLLLDEHLGAGGVPLLTRDDRWCVHVGLPPLGGLPHKTGGGAATHSLLSEPTSASDDDRGRGRRRRLRSKRPV